MYAFNKIKDYPAYLESVLVVHLLELFALFSVLFFLFGEKNMLDLYKFNGSWDIYYLFYKSLNHSEIKNI